MALAHLIRWRCRRLVAGRAIGLALLIATVGSGVAAAAGPLAPAGQFGVSPARRHVVGEPGINLSQSVVVNTTGNTYRVTVIPVLETQAISGSFGFSLAPADVALASRYLTASPSSVTLTPDREAHISLHWNGLPPRAKELVIGVIYRGVLAKQNAAVQVVTQLLQTNFLRLPSATTVAGRFTAIHAGQAGKRVLEVTPRVQNTGDRAWSPSATSLVIRNRAGAVVYRTPWAADVVIPGAQRDFPIEIHKLLPAGSYEMRAGMSFGRPQTITGSFTLAGPNQLPTPGIAIPYFNAIGTIGAPARVGVRVVSSGTSPADLTLHLTMVGTGGFGLGRHLHGSTTLSFTHLAPGAVRRRLLTMGPPLASGDYQVTGTWTDATGAPHTLQSAFAAKVEQSSTSKLWHWITGHLVWIIAVLVLILLLAWFLRRQRRLERELAEAKAAAAANAGAGAAGGSRDDESAS